MGEKNNVMCEYLAKPEIFADFVNAGYFHGEKVVMPEQLIDGSQVSFAGGGKKEGDGRSTGIARKNGAGERSRDVVKIDHRGTKYVIIGIENQYMVHYAMPLRCMEYDVREYRKQLCRLKEKNLQEDRKARQTGENANRKLNPQEFLSGMRKADKLNPVITIVFYHGKSEYDGCINLHDMLDLGGENSIFKPYTADYKMNLVTLDDLEEEKCESGLRELIGFLKCVQNKEKLQEYCRKNKERIQNMDEDTYHTITVMLDFKGLQDVEEQCRNEEGGRVNMCKAVEDWAEELRQEGMNEGINKGIEIFVLDNLEEKKTDEEIAAKLVKRFSLREEQAWEYLHNVDHELIGN